MKPKQTIKLIKSDRREIKERAIPGRRRPQHAEQQIARHVAGWVKELNQNRPSETLRSFASLFAPVLPAKPTS